MNGKWKIYALICPVSGLIRYVGKSSNYKARYKQHCTDFGTETYKKMWVQKLRDIKQIPFLKILASSDNEKDARFLENKCVLENIETVYNIFMPEKNTPTISDYRKLNNIFFNCEFELKKMDTDKYNKK